MENRYLNENLSSRMYKGEFVSMSSSSEGLPTPLKSDEIYFLASSMSGPTCNQNVSIVNIAASSIQTHLQFILTNKLISSQKSNAKLKELEKLLYLGIRRRRIPSLKSCSQTKQFH